MTLKESRSVSSASKNIFGNDETGLDSTVVRIPDMEAGQSVIVLVRGMNLLRRDLHLSSCRIG
jgi:hypothetical protein